MTIFIIKFVLNIKLIIKVIFLDMESYNQESIRGLSNFIDRRFNNDYLLTNNKNFKISNDQSQSFSLGSKSKYENILTDGFNEVMNIGPNVNLKFPKKGDRSEEQKEFFKRKINKTKKTEMCKNWVLFGDCFYKDNCSFAHGEHELRNKLLLQNNDNQKYKTKPCRTFIEKSFCPFGNRCQYTHEVSQHRLLTYKALNLKLANGIMIEAMKKENEVMEFSKLIENVKMNINFKM